MTSRAVELIGAPTDIGAAHRGASMGPEALRVAGLDLRLRKLGLEVIDAGNLAGPANPDGAVENGYRHLREARAWCLVLKDAVYQSLAGERMPVVMGGDHTLAIGSVAAVAQFCAERERPFSILWLDAHADFNTSSTSPSGNLHGMPVAILCGTGPDALTGIGPAVPIVDPGQIIQVGVRSVDRIEKRAVVDSGLVVYDLRMIDERGMRAVMDDALDAVASRGGHLHISFDVDFLDPGIAPGVGTTVIGGPSYREAQLCMEMIHDSDLLGSIDLCELNPALDLRNQTADVVVELVASLFGEQILSRTTTAFD